MSFVGIAKLASICSDYSKFEIRLNDKLLEVTVHTSDVEDKGGGMMHLKADTKPVQVVEIHHRQEDAVFVPSSVRGEISKFPRGYNDYLKKRA